MHIRKNIRELRLQNRLSQERLGEMLGVTGQAISKWEQGITSPDISLLPLIAECFSVTIDSLFQGPPAMRHPGYGSKRGELLALYTGKDGTEYDYRRAEEAYTEVILSGKASSEDYVSYGILHRVRASRDVEIALYYFRRAIAEGNDKRDLQWMAAHQALTNLLYDHNRIEEAIEEHRSWRDTEPDCAWAYVSYAYALEKAGHLEKAYKEISTALTLDSDDVNVRTMAGDIFAKTGRYDEAIIHWDKAFQLDPSCISCLFSKAEMFASVSKFDKAIKQYEKILEWLANHGYNMDVEGIYPQKRISDLRIESQTHTQN